MAKLNQIVAVVAGKKTRTEKEFGEINKTVQKADLFYGLSRKYEPVDEGGEELPPEAKYPQKNVRDVLQQVRDMLVGMMDVVATQEYGNCLTKADVKVDGLMVVKDVPVTVLLYLEKQLNDMHTFVGNLPTLDPAERWSFSEQLGQFVTEPTRTIRTKKVQKPIVLYQATEEHPAQTQLVTEDITAGHWITTKFATAMAVPEKQKVLARIVKLQDAVKVAREEANGIEVKDMHVADGIFQYLFGK